MRMINYIYLNIVSKYEIFPVFFCTIYGKDNIVKAFTIFPFINQEMSKIVGNIVQIVTENATSPCSQNQVLHTIY